MQVLDAELTEVLPAEETRQIAYIFKGKKKKEECLFISKFLIKSKLHNVLSFGHSVFKKIAKKIQVQLQLKIFKCSQ